MYAVILGSSPDSATTKQILNYAPGCVHLAYICISGRNMRMCLYQLAHAAFKSANLLDPKKLLCTNLLLLKWMPQHVQLPMYT